MPKHLNLTPTQERARWGANPGERTPQQREQLIEDHLELVGPLVQKMAGPSLFLEEGDLEGAAMLGLCKAADIWDADRATFNTIAWRYMVGAIQHERRDNSGVKSWLYELSGKIFAAEERLESRGEPATDEAVAAEIGIIRRKDAIETVTADMVADWRSWHRQTVSLDTLLNPEDGGDLDKCAALTERAVTDLDTAVVVREAIQGLHPRQQAVMVLRFWHGMTITDIARAAGYSVHYIHVIEKSAFRRLRNVLARAFDEDLRPEDAPGAVPRNARKAKHPSADDPPLALVA